MMCKTNLSDELLHNINVAGGTQTPKAVYLFIYNFCAESFLS